MKSHHRAFYSISFVIILVGLVAFLGLQNSQTKREAKTFSGFIRSFDSNTSILFISSPTPDTDPLLKQYKLSLDASITTLVSPNSSQTHTISYNNFNIEYINADTKIANFPFDFEADGSIIIKMTERFTP